MKNWSSRLALELADDMSSQAIDVDVVGGVAVK